VEFDIRYDLWAVIMRNDEERVDFTNTISVVSNQSHGGHYLHLGRWFKRILDNVGQLVTFNRVSRQERQHHRRGTG